jgi:S-DNA-T family DNA segregation ATPase FtsK/SpoIIIE
MSMQSSEPVVVQRQRPRGLADAFVMLLVALVAGWLLVVWAVVKRPILSIPVVVYVGLVVWLGAHDAQALALYVVIVLVVWRVAHKRSFERLVGGPLRCWWRRLWVYERRWRSTLVLCGLGKRYRLREGVPRIRRVDSNRWRDRVQIRLVAGQCTEDVERVSDELAHSFGAQACRVREHGPGRLWLDFRTRDPLIELVPALPVVDTVDLMAVAVGRREDGEPWRVRVLGMHLLLAGVMGSGKSSVLWSLLRGLGPAIRDGTVAVWAADPKGGMELGLGAPLFTRFCGGAFEALADLLDDAVDVMKDRARRLAGVTRLHEPTRAEPLILVVVDEVATLTAYQPDRKLRARIEHSLGLLLTQGRAVGVSVVAALQDPRKEVLGFRNLFPARVALQLDEPTQVDMVLGQGARDQGALCDKIPDATRGVAYVRIDGVREPTRVRAAYVTDQDIKVMVHLYAPGPGPGARLRAVLEGHADGGPRLTAEQRREVDEIRGSWGEGGEQA